jgi:hypothetical protein
MYMCIGYKEVANGFDIFGWVNRWMGWTTDDGAGRISRFQPLGAVTLGDNIQARRDMYTRKRAREKTKTKRKTGSILVLRKTIFFFFVGTLHLCCSRSVASPLHSRTIDRAESFPLVELHGHVQPSVHFFFFVWTFRVTILTDHQSRKTKKQKRKSNTKMLCQTNKLIFVLLLSLPIPSQVKLVKDKWPRSVDRIARMVSCHTRLISAGLNFFIFILCRILFTT